MSRKKEVEVGDLIEIFRSGYQHWAIYVGHGYVIHLTPPSEVLDCWSAGSSSVTSVLCDWALVKKEKLSDVVGKDYFQVNNLLDDEYEPRNINLVLKEARSLEGRILPYNIFSKNCEHFVTDLRYGKPTSRQVRQAVTIVGILGAIGLLALTTALFSKSEKEKKNTYW